MVYVAKTDSNNICLMLYNLIVYLSRSKIQKNPNNKISGNVRGIKKKKDNHSGQEESFI